MIIPINKPLLAKIQSIQNSAPQKTPLTAELVKAQTRIKQLEAENKALRIRPLAIAPIKPQSPAKASPPIPLMANGKQCSLALARLKMAQDEADKKAASDAVSAQRPAGKIVLNKSKYSV